MAAEPTRRRILSMAGLATLTGAGALGAAGCSARPWPWATPPRPAPDVGILKQAITAESAMVDRYTAALAACPALRGQLSPLLGEHRQHLDQLRARLAVPAGALPSASAVPSPARPRLPAGQAATLAWLRTAEHGAAADAVRRLAGVSPSLAQLLASIGASEASHLTFLEPGR